MSTHEADDSSRMAHLGRSETLKVSGWFTIGGVEYSDLVEWMRICTESMTTAINIANSANPPQENVHHCMSLTTPNVIRQYQNITTCSSTWSSNDRWHRGKQIHKLIEIIMKRNLLAKISWVDQFADDPCHWMSPF